MSVRTLELKPVVSFASVVKAVKSPLRVPAWSIVVVVAMAGVYGYVMGRQNPLHHYVPYIGYPLVMDTTTGKACYSSAPKPPDSATGITPFLPSDANGALTDPGATPNPTGPTIPMCGK